MLTRHSLRRFAILAVALLSLSIPAVAQAAGTATTITSDAGSVSSPFSIGVPQTSGATTATTATPTVATSTTTSANGSFGTVDIIIIVAAVLVLIVGVSWFILRDSRKTSHRLHLDKNRRSLDETPRSGSKAPPRTRKLSAAEKKRRKRGRAPRRR